MAKDLLDIDDGEKKGGSCWGLHSWGPWSQESAWTLSRRDIVTGKQYLNVRHCKRCNKSQRKVEKIDL